MFSLPPSIAPRSVPLTMTPPRQRASRFALYLALAAWAFLAVTIALQAELTDEFAHPEAWRGLARRVLLGASGCCLFAGAVAGIWGFRRAVVQSTIALVLCAAWVAAIVVFLRG